MKLMQITVQNTHSFLVVINQCQVITLEKGGRGREREREREREKEREREMNRVIITFTNLNLKNARGNINNNIIKIYIRTN